MKNSFEFKQQKAANLPALKQQLKDIEETFGGLLKRLPSKSEIAELLVDISQQGLGAGLEFELFKPGDEQPRDFYAEVPIEIKVVGYITNLEVLLVVYLIYQESLRITS